MAKTSPIALAREVTASRPINAIQESARRATSPATSCPINNGLSVGPVSFSAGVAKDVPHGLGRAWRGWFLIDADTTPTFARPSQTDATKFLTLNADINCSATLWIF